MAEVPSYSKVNPMAKFYLDDEGVVQYDPTSDNAVYRRHIRRKATLMILNSAERTRRQEAVQIAKRGGDLTSSVDALLQIHAVRRKVMSL